MTDESKQQKSGSKAKEEEKQSGAPSEASTKGKVSKPRNSNAK